MGLLTLLGGVKMFLDRSFMTLTPEGIGPSTGGLIPWADIRDMRYSVIGIGRNKSQYVQIELADRTRYDASQRLGPSGPLRWRVLTKGFANDVVSRARDYAARLPR